MSVLVCYDGSPSARNAVATMADLVSEHAVTLLHVWNPPMPVLTDALSDRANPGGPSTATLTELSGQRAAEIVEEGRRIAQAHEIAAQTLTACNESSLAETILRVADEQDSSLIILGAHLRGTPGPTLESTSAAVFTRARRPVLVIPMSDRAVPDVPVGAAPAPAR